MLFQVGPLLMDTFGLELQEVQEEVNADFAEHDLIGKRRDLEFSGPGAETLELGGKFLPYHVGGLSDFKLARSLTRIGAPQFVMRGDGEVYGWYQILKTQGKHTYIAPSGVGFVVEHGLSLKRVDDPGQEAGASLIGTILSLLG